MPAEKNSNTSEEDLEGMQKQLADLAVRSDLDVKSDQQASNITYQEEEDEDSYLNDPLIKYTLDLHDYTKRLYIEARIAHEKLQKERSRGGKAGRSGIEAMGRKTAATPRY
ncbi:hypothetical protein NliqN6_4793 [Naganishia liquefaciens]|uniref:Uncharacterized protein n=1 Tax=Naganishia liquefaciens TaxID=104408 RepID=A0A8H3YIA6_9TREE|nr:hypothetical protein NliqN6_4793 [Naganishia liquefaciens]